MPERLPTRDAITQFLFLSDEPEPVDLCLVLGSRYPETMDPAVALFQKGWTPRILISGHGPDEEQVKEADVFCEYAVARGVPREAILLEREARHTKDNFVLSARLVEDWKSIRKVAIVGKPYHMRRALMSAERFWPVGIEYVLLPSQLPQDLHAHDWWLGEWGRRRILDELRRIGEYGVNGDLGGY
jgi:uncharacterized SAM-binding protein YcdF (DUF218 family)